MGIEDLLPAGTGEMADRFVRQHERPAAWRRNVYGVRGDPPAESRQPVDWVDQVAAQGVALVASYSADCLQAGRAEGVGRQAPAVSVSAG